MKHLLTSLGIILLLPFLFLLVLIADLLMSLERLITPKIRKQNTINL